jgi:GntR family transcriptional repressor for pyruvate dehydrogenase complex
MVIDTTFPSTKTRVTSPQARGLGMLPPGEERELLLLLAISSASVPIGSPKLAQELADRGIVLGEATVGRLLRSLEANGLVSGHGRHGRSLTPLGRSRLSELQTKREHAAHVNHFTDVLRTIKPSHFVDVLVARRAIEAELAALAAERASRSDVKRLEHIILESQRHLASGTYDSADDVRFHDAIAMASRNKVLLAAFRWILHTQSLFPLFMYIRKKTSGDVFVDHKRVFEAIAGRSPEEARHYMVIHLDRVIQDVGTYWRKKRHPSEGKKL